MCGQNCKYFVCDVSNSDYDALFNKLECIYGAPIDVLINNAGTYIHREPLAFSIQDFDEIVNLNAKAVFFLTQSYLRYCKEKQIKGNIIVTSSNRSLMGDIGPYGASKAAVNNLVQGFSREFASLGIRINCVCPGMTASNINHINPNENLYMPNGRGNRVLLPEEIAEVICFLASDLSKCITGAVIPCDEGDHLR